MAGKEDTLKKIIAHSKEYGFVYPSSEIYDGLSAVYDYGPNGTELKKNIRNYWWKSMVQMHENIVGIDAAIFMHPTVWKASGHVDAFNDPLIDNKDSKKRYRADVLVEDYIAKIEAKIDKEINKAKKRFGEAFDEQQFRETNPRVVANIKKIDDIKNRLYPAMDKNDESIRQFAGFIKAETGSQTVDGVSAYLDFDPTILQIQEIVPNTSQLPLTLQNTYDNNTGEIDYAAGELFNFPSGDFAVAQIRLVATTAIPTGGTILSFHAVTPRQTDVTFSGNSVLDATTSATISTESTAPCYARWSRSGRYRGCRRPLAPARK
jgi:hypothetical protein